ncbi:unnamed protein product [Psylliodes chrysocephalus]|uniref:Regucalcin n=1 Tax=Psylliodes chrysocephalus TaxID=3402493 RepID=A0A9P0CU32_9CUCU|nr:unnamed protein product [Psylliodes chrysocephala]
MECISCGYKIRSITPPVQHGEGPVWHSETSTFYWVDTFKSTVYRLPQDGAIQSYKLEGRDSVGFILPIKGKNDTFLVFADRVVYKLHWPFEKKKKINLQKIMSVEDDKPLNQFNDGKVDAKGRVWGGTLSRNRSDLSVSNHGGSFYLFDSTFTSIKEKITKTSISNGLAWCSDSTKFYYIDSQTRYVQEYTFKLETGNITNRKIVFDLKQHPELSGIPDGMTIDANDNLWIALFGGSHIIRVDPRTKKILMKIKMPATYITSVVFGGPNLDILYATTSRLKFEAAPEKLEKEPLAGSVFAITNLGVKGVPGNCVTYNRY